MTGTANGGSSYRAMSAKVSALVGLDPHPDLPEGERLQVFSALVEACEAEHYPIALSDPIDAIRFQMVQIGMVVADLVPYIGPRNRVYEVLNGTWPLTMSMIRRLLALGIPASSLVGQPEPVEA